MLAGRSRSHSIASAKRSEKKPALAGSMNWLVANVASPKITIFGFASGRGAPGIGGGGGGGVPPTASAGGWRGRHRQRQRQRRVVEPGPLLLVLDHQLAHLRAIGLQVGLRPDQPRR